ncbi:MAG: tetraacyldisaccharide 4'-kinase [Gemmatimonadota bacterium]
MGSAHEWVRRWWAGSAGVGFRAADLAALPLEMMFRLLVGLRALAYRHGWLRSTGAEIPVVSVGNLSVGGTGKTPVAAFLARLLLQRGRVPGIVLRGYGEDELALHRRWLPDIPVVAHRDRREGVRQAARAGADVAILDDGFQHMRLLRDVDLVLISAEQLRAVQKGHLLPRGPLREPLAALGRASAAVLTARTADTGELRSRIRQTAPDLPIVELRLSGGAWIDLTGRPAGAPTAAAVAVASIARPEDFERMAEASGVEITDRRWFPDHHAYTDAEISAMERWAAGRPLLTTEKDAVKLAGRTGADWRVLPLRVDVQQGRDVLEALLTKVAR